MKLAYNPLGLGAYTPAPTYEDDIIFDLVTKVTYVKGVPFYGKKYEYFKKHTSPDNTGGSEGLVPAPSYTTTNTRLLREDGEWVHVSGASPPDTILDVNSTNTVENLAVAKEIQKINALVILKAEHVYKNIVVNGVLIQAQGVNDTLEFILGDGIALTPNSDDKTIMISTRVLGLLGISTSYASGQLIVTVDNLYFNRWNEAYDWYRSVTDEDTDIYINKWQEIVDFLNNVQSGTNILDEFVTRKTSQEIIGAKTFTLPITSSVAAGTAPFVVDSPTLVTNLNTDLWDGKHFYKSFDDSENIDSSALLWWSNGTSTGLASMQYATVLNVNVSNGRRWQIWNSRNNRLLYWRPELVDMSGYAPEHILLDSFNYKGFIELMYWANILVLSISDPNTSPIFLNATTTGTLQTNLIRDLASNWILGLDPETADLNIGTAAKNHYIALLTTTADNEVFINDLGNTGIGTKTPIAKLHVVGTTRLDGLNYIISFSPNYYDTWSDGTNSHPWYGYDHRYENTGVYSTVISDYYGMTLKTAYCNISISASNVGIGIYNPEQRLHIFGQTLLSQTANGNLYYQVRGLTYHMGFGLGSGGVNRGIYDFTNAAWMIYRNNTLNVLIPSGNVGIGTTIPSFKLDVTGNIRALGEIKVQGSTSPLQQPCVNWHDENTTGFHVSYRLGETGKPLRFYYQATTTYTKLIDITSTGSVGIGTTSPIHKLHVAGAGVFSNTGSTNYSTNGITIGAGDAAARYITCYGKTGTSYINVGYSTGTNNSGEFFFNYVGSGSTSNYSGIGIYGGANYIYLYPGNTTFKKPLILPGSLYNDDYNSGALFLSNSNILGVNAIYFADTSDSALEGINFYRSSTTVDTIWGTNGTLYYTPNRTLGSTGTNYPILHAGNWTDYSPKSTVWTASTTVNAWRRVLTISGYGNILLSMCFSLNSLASLHLYLVNLGWQSASVVLLGYNYYSYNHNILVRVTYTSATTYHVEVYNPYGYNGATTIPVGCRATILDNNCSITPITANTGGGGTVVSSLTSGYATAANFNADLLDGHHESEFVHAGSINYSDSLIALSSRSRSWIGSWYNTTTTRWYNVISVRHRNNLSDGYEYGMILYSDLTGSGDLYWNKEWYGNTYLGERKILDSVNYTSTLDGRYVNVTGDTMTGNLILKGSTSATMTYADNTHPSIRFDNANSSLNIKIMFTDYDSYRSPSGLKLIGNLGGEWLEVVGSIYTGGYFISTVNGKTIQIGSQNSSWCHYSTTAPAHWFNTNVEVNGYHAPHVNTTYTSGTSSKRWSNIYSVLGNFAGAITTASTPGSWVSGMTGAAILYRGLSAIDASSFWRFYNMKSSSGHVVCYGGLGNNIGFYGYYAGRTANSYDWCFTANTANGNWTATASIYAAHFYENSDILLKTNIQSILNSNNIPEIREFDWVESGEHSYGLIAQELEEQGYSELVSTKDDGYKTVNYSAALSLIVGKLQVKIKELEKEIENLKNKN